MPATDKAAKGRGAIQIKSPAGCKRKPPAAVPARMAANVQSSNRPFPAARRSCGINSGRMPYFDGPKSALCAPIPHKTINGRMPPLGFSQSATVPALIRSTSTALIAMMTVRLLRRSAKVPPTNDNNISGKVKMMKVIAVCVCAAVSSSGPGTICAVACRMANRATMSFQALSLNAPQNWAMRRPRSGWRMDEDVSESMCPESISSASIGKEIRVRDWRSQATVPPHQEHQCVQHRTGVFPHETDLNPIPFE